MRTIASIGVVFLVVTAGCSMHELPGKTETPPPREPGVSFYASSQQQVADEFATLNVTVVKVGLHPANASPSEGWITRAIPRKTVKLARLTGSNAMPLSDFPVFVPAGEYDAVRLYVESASGTRPDGTSANVTYSNESLTVSKTWILGDEERATYLVDLTVFQRADGSYTLRTVATSSGTRQPITYPPENARTYRSRYSC